MKKGILVGLIAAMMLFAFTACDSGTPTTPLYGKSVQSVTLVSQPNDYIVNLDTIQPEDLTIRVEYNDGSYTDYSGVEMKAEVGNSPISSTLTSVEVTVPGVSVTSGEEYFVTISAYNPTDYSINVNGAEQKELSLNADELSLAGVDYVVTYNGSSTKTYDITDLGKTAITFNTGDLADLGYKANDTVNVVEALKKAWTADDKTEYLSLLEKVTGEWTVRITETEIANVVLEQVVTAKADGTSENEIFSGNELSKVAYKGTITFNDDTAPVPFTSDDLGSVAVEFPKHQTTYKITGNTTIPVKVTYNGDSFEADLDVSVVADYPTAFSVEKKSGVEATEFDYTEGETVDLSNYDFTVSKWASGTTYTEENPAPFTVDYTDFNTPAAIKLGAAVGDNKTVDVSYNGTKGVQTVKPATVTYDVVKAE